MRRYLFFAPLFALISTLTSFGFIAVVLGSQVGQDSYISPVQMYVVIAISAAAMLCSLGLLAQVIFELIGKGAPDAIGRVVTKAIVLIGFIFCGLSTWAFFLIPTDFYEDFLLKFTHSARFEFLMIGVSALATAAISHFVKQSSK